MSKLRILILDDSDIVLSMTALALNEEGFEAYTASSLMEFDEVLSQKDPDIILTDIKMPDISGLDVCRILKKKHHTKLVPIILFSTLDEPELAKLAERSGADGYVCKNNGIDEIVNSIKKLVDEIVF